MKKKIYVCPKCGRGLNFSNNPEYTFQCMDCDEDFYSFEAKEMEQPRMEGVVDYTDLARASMEIKAITDRAISDSQKQIEIKSKDILGQICEYISETVKPIINSGIYKDTRFSCHAAIYNKILQLDFNDYGGDARGYQAQLFGDGGCLRVYFNGNNEFIITQFDSSALYKIVESWPGFKDSMNRMIPYALREYDKENKKRIEKQVELSKIIDNFKL